MGQQKDSLDLLAHQMQAKHSPRRSSAANFQGEGWYPMHSLYPIAIRQYGFLIRIFRLFLLYPAIVISFTYPPMEHNHSAVLHNYGDKPKWEPHQLPELKEDQLLVEVEATTINPSDLLFLEGKYFQKPLPSLCGFEGVGKVAKSTNKTSHLQDKRVSFSVMGGGGGAWSNFAVVRMSSVFPIEPDVPASSAASGIINPITALGFISQTRRIGQNGLIHTAAASALGRMVNKLCIKEKMTLINVVRRQEQAEILKAEGAQHVIVTTGDWQHPLKELMQQFNVKVLFDALGGGEVQGQILKLLPSDGTAYIYGSLQNKPTQVSCTSLIGGLTLTGFYLLTWFGSLTEEERTQIANNHSARLKNELSSTTSKEFKLSEIEDALKYYKENMTKGKVLLRP